MDPAAHEAARRAIEVSGMGPVTRLSPFPRGMSNTVLRAELTNGSRLVARVSRAGTKRYVMERLVMGRARQAGIPCPEVHAIVAVDQVEVMLLEHVEGVPLAEVADGSHMADSCGAMLARIHSLGAERFGNLDVDGRGSDASLESWFVDSYSSKFAALAAGSDAGITATARRVADKFEQSRPLLRDADCSLVHGDFSPFNVVTNDGTIAGVLDWESAKGGPPAFDFGWWDWLAEEFGTPFSTEEMIAAYTRHRSLDLTQTTELRQLVQLRILVGQAAWAVEAGDFSLVGTAVDRIKALGI